MASLITKTEITREALKRHFDDFRKSSDQIIGKVAGCGKSTIYRFRTGSAIAKVERLEAIYAYLKKEGYIPEEFEQVAQLKETAHKYPIRHPEALTKIRETLIQLIDLIDRDSCTVAQLGFIKGGINMIAADLIPRAVAELEKDNADNDQ